MMSLCINFPLFSLLILLRNQIILGVNVTVTEDDTVCVGNNITVTCTIDPFASPPSATWNRNGSALTTCTSGGICTTDSLIINGIKYSFLGGSNEIKVSLQVQQVEDGIQWNCAHNGITYPYTFDVLNKCEVTTEGSTEGPTVTTEMSSTSTSQDQTTSSQNPSIASFHNTQKTETTIMTTTDNDLTSASLHVSSEVTTPIKTESDNLTDLGVSAIIAIAVSGSIFLFLIIILIICCCHYYRKNSKKKTSEKFQEIRDDVVPKFWTNFNGHRYGINVLNGSTVHLARGYNQYQGEYDGGRSTVPSTNQSDYFNCRRSNRKHINENPKHKPKQSHGFPQSISDNIMNRFDINGIHTYALHDNNQITRTYYRGQAVSSPRRFEYRGAFLPGEYNNHNRRSSPYMTYLQDHVPRDLEGLTIYKGHNRATNKGSRRYY